MFDKQNLEPAEGILVGCLGCLQGIKAVFYWGSFFFPMICVLAMCFFYNQLSYAYLHYLPLLGLFLLTQVVILLFYYYFRKVIFAVFLTAAIAFGAAYLFIVKPTELNLIHTNHI